jgi:hypothetical protein
MQFAAQGGYELDCCGHGSRGGNGVIGRHKNGFEHGHLQLVQAVSRPP